MRWQVGHVPMYSIAQARGLTTTGSSRRASAAQGSGMKLLYIHLKAQAAQPHSVWKTQTVAKWAAKILQTYKRLGSSGEAASPSHLEKSEPPGESSAWTAQAVPSLPLQGPIEAGLKKARCCGIAADMDCGPRRPQGQAKRPGRRLSSSSESA